MAKYRKIKRNQRIYRKRRRVPSWIKFILILLLAIGVGYIGGKAVMDGLRNAQEARQNSSQAQDSSQTSEDSSNPSSESQTSEMQPAAEEAMSARVMPIDVMKNPEQRQQFIQTVKNEGSNTIILDLKDETGYLHYQSANEIVQQCNAVAADAVNLSQVCQEITAAGLTPVGRISTLMDMVSSRVAAGTTYLYRGQSDTAWLDAAANNGGKTWLSPYRENTGAFLAGLADEITEAGCSRLILTHLEYPSQNTNDMGLSGETVSRTDALRAVYQQIAAAAEQNSAQVMLQLDLEDYYGSNREVSFGGEPSAIGAEQVLLSVSTETLSAYQGLEILAGETDPARAAQRIGETIASGGVQVSLLVPETEQAVFASAAEHLSGIASQS